MASVALTAIKPYAGADMPSVSALHAHGSASVWFRCTGFSLTELLVAVAIASMLTAAALPSWREFLQAQSLKAASSEMMNSLAIARAHALRSGSTVDVVPRDASNWSRGWVLIRDTNGNRRLDEDEPVLHAFGPITDMITVTLHFNGGTPQFGPSGRATRAGNVVMASGRGRRKLIVNLLGRTRLCDPDASTATC